MKGCWGDVREGAKEEFNYFCFRAIGKVSELLLISYQRFGETVVRNIQCSYSFLLTDRLILSKSSLVLVYIFHC